MKKESDSFNKFIENISYISQEIPRVMIEFSNKSIENNYFSYDAGNEVSNMISKLFSDPSSLLKFNSDIQQNYSKLVKNISDKLSGIESNDEFPSDIRDHRFSDPEWTNNPYFSYIKQNYIMISDVIEGIIKSNNKFDNTEKKIMLFMVKQAINASSPSNFLFTNPTAIAEAVKNNADNLVDGIKKMSEDISSSNFKIGHLDLNAFTIGENIAITKGKVIYRDKLLEIIYYYNEEEKFDHSPLLIIPPLINKYYIFDLQEKNSMVKWMSENKIPSFIISWKIADETYKNIGIEDYIKSLESALDFIIKSTKSKTISLMSYCISGTLTSILSAYLSAKGKNIISSCTFLATFIDFSDVGELEVFINRKNLNAITDNINKKGYLDGADLYNAFNLLRSNEMIWNNIVSRYILSKPPVAFDLLYWNYDNTKIPAKFYNFYLEEIFINNRLISQDNPIYIKGLKIDISNISCPCYFFAAQEDHIVPWESSYSALKYFNCSKRFVLGQSGHVSGVINHPSRKKYGYYVVNNLMKKPKIQEDKLQNDSWWVDWKDWYFKNSKTKEYSWSKEAVDKLAITDAPGEYVFEK